MINLTSQQMNLMIRMINDNDSRKKASKYFNEEQLATFDNMKKELKEMRKDDPSATFSPVETDW